MKTAYINGRNIWPPDAFYVQFVDSGMQPAVGKITPKWTFSGNNLEYKIRGKDWISFNSGTQLTSGSDGKIYFRCFGRTKLFSMGSTTNAWVTTENFIAKGRLAYMLDWDNAETMKVGSFGFSHLFFATKIIEADFIFTDITDNYPYDSMVRRGSNLKKFVGREMYKTTLNKHAWYPM
jgi:hypothetical protein